MDRLFTLWAFDRDLLSRFSERSTELLTGRSPVSFTASLTTAYLRRNVEKEVEKDRFVIDHAAAAFDAGRLVSTADVDDLFERSKEVDRVFVRELVLPSVCIAIRYDDIEATRKRRILFLARFVENLLMAWPTDAALTDVFILRYSSGRFRDLIGEYLGLYCVETRQLANSVKFLPPFNRAMDLFLEELLEIMEQARAQVAQLFTDRIYSPEGQLPARTSHPRSVVR